MAEDASLDDFRDVGADDGVEDGEGREGPANARDENDGRRDDGDGGREVRDESAGDGQETDLASESVVTPTGARCADCDRAVSRRWRRDGALVCGDCVDW